MLSRTEELTALFETLGVLSCALMACLSRGWCTAIDEAREQVSSIEAIDDDWVRQQLLLWAERHHKRVKNFQSGFLMSVLPRFYTGLGKLHIGLLPRRDTDTGSPYRRYRRFPKVDLRFPALDEALKQLTSSCTQLRELDVARQRDKMSNVSLIIVASNCSNLQKLTFSSGTFGSHGIDDVGLAALAQGCKQLEHLQILSESLAFYRNRKLTHEGVVAVARSCRLLKTLCLSAGDVEDPALLALGQYCPLLRSLSFHGSGITDAAVAALVRGCPQLEVVELPYARITDASASALAQGCPNLKTLDFLRTGVTAAGVLTLAKHAKQMLTIRTDCMDGAAARALAEEHPVKVRAQIKPTEHIDLAVSWPSGNRVYFRMKETTQLQKLMHVFCANHGITTNSVRFLLDGNRINENHTPEQLDMEDGDVIDVMAEQ